MIKDDGLNILAVKNKVSSISALHEAEKKVLLKKIETRDFLIEVLVMGLIMTSCVIGIMLVVLSTKGV